MSNAKDLVSLLTKLNVKDEKVHIDAIQTKYDTLSKTLGEEETSRAILNELLDSEQYSAIIKAHRKIPVLFSPSATAKPNSFSAYEQYACYKVGKEKKFASDSDVSLIGDELMSLETLTDSQRQLLHIYAQNLLKKKKPKKAYEVYQKLLAIPHELDNTAELACNKEAALSEIPELVGNVTLDKEFDTYDISFNKACQLCSIRNHEAALEYAERAFNLAQEDDAVVEDLRAIKLQISYIHQVLGHKEEAKSLLKEIVENSADQNDLNTVLAKANLKSYVSISKFKDNLPLLLRELDTPTLTGKHSQFSFQQAQIISSNIELLKVFSNNKAGKNKTSVHSIANKFYTENVGNVLYEPYENQADALCKKLDRSAKAEIKNEQKLLIQTLVCVQVLVKAGNLDKALVVAEKVWNHFPMEELSKYKRILSYVLLNLYDATNRSSSTSKHLSKLLRLYSEQVLEEDVSFWEFIAFKFLEQGQTQKAERIFRALAAKDNNSASAKYIAKADASDLGDYVDANDINGVIVDVNVDSLLNAGISVFENGKSKSSVIKSTPKKKRRVHKNKKLPKNFDESKKLDPERWLPLKERSTYRVSKKNISGKNTQGFKASKASEAKLDITKKAVKKPAGKKTSNAKSKNSRKH